jgi:hypothetical protein
MPTMDSPTLVKEPGLFRIIACIRLLYNLKKK